MCVGMCTYHLSTVIAKKEFKKPIATVLKIIEILGYTAPVILGIVPMSAGLQSVGMIIAVVGVFAAMQKLTFNGVINFIKVVLWLRFPP